MVQRMNWQKNKKYSGREEKYEAGKVMDNGRVVAGPKPDRLALRADQALRKFLAANGMNNINDKPKPRGARS